MITYFFRDLYQSIRSNAEPILRLVDKKVKVDQCNFLTKAFEAQEVKDVIFVMHPDKAPRPYGLNLGFY